MKQHANTEGFSLIELTVVMVIIGLLMAGIFAYLNVNLQQKKIDNTLDHTKQNLASLQDFITKDLVNAAGQKVDRSGNVLLATDTNTYYEHRLPCPATPGLKPGDPDFGVEQCPPGNSTFKGVKVATGTAGQRVFIGAYPSATLQTYGENSVDGYRGAYVYAVTKSLTNKTLEPVQTGKEPGAVIVQYIDKNDKLTTYPNKPFALISTGENGTAANASNLDFENNNGDATFLAQENRSSNPDFFYDDRVSFGFTESAEADNCVPTALDVQQFLTNGKTWKKPDGFSYAVVEMFGAAGAGSGCSKETTSSQPNKECSYGRGGSGGYITFLRSNTQLNDEEAVTIGIGGEGASNNEFYTDPIGKDGGATSFAGITLSGGKGGAVTYDSSNSIPVDGKKGTATGGIPVIFNYIYNADNNAEAPVCGGREGPGGGTGNGGSYHYNCSAGKGTDGVVLIKSYICK